MQHPSSRSPARASSAPKLVLKQWMWVNCLRSVASESLLPPSRELSSLLCVVAEGTLHWRIRDSRAEATLHCNFRVPFALNSLCSKYGEEILCAVSSGAPYSIDPLCRRFLVRPISWGEVFFVGCAYENGRDGVAVRYDGAVIKIMQMTRGRSVVLGFILGEPRKVLRLVGTDPGPKILRGCSAAP